MLVTKMSAGTVLQVNLRNPLHAGDEAHKEIHSGFQTQNRYQQK